jgi:hypothetical protein
MSPLPEPQTHTAYLDPRLRVEITAVSIAAHLVLAGHPLVQVVLRSGQSFFIFHKAAQPALNRLHLACDELNAYRERAVAGNHAKRGQREARP